MFPSYIAHITSKWRLYALEALLPHAALALMQPFSAKSIRRNKFLLGTHLLHLGRERQLWTKCLV